MLTKNWKHRSECDLVNRFVIYGKEETKKKTFLKMMMSEVSINLNIFGPFMKTELCNNQNNTFVVTIHKSEKKNTHISQLI